MIMLNHLLVHVNQKEENESLKLRVDQLEMDVAEHAKKASESDRRIDRLHSKLE